MLRLVFQVISRGRPTTNYDSLILEYFQILARRLINKFKVKVVVVVDVRHEKS